MRLRATGRGRHVYNYDIGGNFHRYLVSSHVPMTWAPPPTLERCCNVKNGGPWGPTRRLASDAARAASSLRSATSIRRQRASCSGADRGGGATAVSDGDGDEEAGVDHGQPRGDGTRGAPRGRQRYSEHLWAHHGEWGEQVAAGSRAAGATAQRPRPSCNQRAHVRFRDDARHAHGRHHDSRDAAAAPADAQRRRCRCTPAARRSPWTAVAVWRTGPCPERVGSGGGGGACDTCGDCERRRECRCTQVAMRSSRTAVATLGTGWCPEQAVRRGGCGAGQRQTRADTTFDRWHHGGNMRAVGGCNCSLSEAHTRRRRADRDLGHGSDGDTE